MIPQYPNVKVQLSGQDGNAFVIIGRISGALRRADVPQDRVKEFQTEAMSGDYNHVLQTAMRWVNVA